MSDTTTFQHIQPKTQNFDMLQGEGSFPVKMWTRGVAVEKAALEQISRMARMPFVYRWLAVMPDVHLGKGATVGSVIPTRGAIIPAAVGVDIGCGMMAARTSLQAADLPDSLHEVRLAIEAAVPHGRTDNGGRNDRGAWGNPPAAVQEAWAALKPDFDAILERHGRIGRANHLTHLGTLGTGNHFIEICLDEADGVWFMLHSGSRGVGGVIGSHFIEKAKQDMRRWFINLPDQDLAYLPEGTEHFNDYMKALSWAQRYAAKNRELMMDSVISAVRSCKGLPPFTVGELVVNCHHNYVAHEEHYGDRVLVTRKGAVRAGEGDLGIIPGSMGTRSYIVRGRGNAESFHSCSHGAGRAMSRAEARRTFTLEDHARATAQVECRKDVEVIDETPGAYKPIDAVMEAQRDLVDILHTLRQVVCVKG